MGMLEWVFCALFLLVGVLLLVVSARAIWLGCRASSWPHTTATMLDAELKMTESSGEDSSTTWEVLVRYEYWVEGSRYEGKRIHPAYLGSSSLRPHAKLHDLLQPPRRVRVYYRAERPEESTLSVGFYSQTLAVFFVGLVFTAFGGGILLNAYSALNPGFIVSVLVLGALSAFYFVVAGRDQFAKGLTLVPQRPARLPKVINRRSRR
jgi:hypothetical protein